MSSKTFSRTCLEHFDQHTAKCPYLTFTLGPGELNRLVVSIWSNDQGRASSVSNPRNPFNDSHTWFAFGVVEEASATNETSEDNLFSFQRNVRAANTVQCHRNEWIIGVSAEDDNMDDESEVQFWLESLSQSEGTKIGIFPLAKYSGWVNTVWKMEVEVISNSRAESPLANRHIDLHFDDDGRFIQQSARHSSMSRQVQGQEMTEIGKFAFEATRNVDPHHADQLEGIGMSLLVQFQNTGSVQSLDLAAKMMGLVVENTPHGHPHQYRRSINYALCLARRHESTYSASTEDLSRAIDILDTVVNAITPSELRQNGVDHGSVLNNLGNFLGRRFEYTKSAQDINKAIRFLERAVENTLQTHRERGGRLNSLARWLAERCRYFDSADDLDRAVQLTDEAINGIPINHPKYPGWLTNLANRLGARFERAGSIDDLHRAVEAAEKSVGITPHGHHMLPNRLNSLGDLLRIRYERTDKVEDLSGAVQVVNEGISAAPQGHPILPSLLGNLGNCFAKRFERTGYLGDLNRSIEELSRSVEKTPEGHFDGVFRRNNLGIQLSRRHTLTGSMADINLSIRSLQMAIDIMPEDHSYQAILQSNIAACLGERHRRNGSADDINDAIAASEKAVQTTSRTHKNYARYLGNLGLWLGVRGESFGSTNDLDRAIEVLETATDMTPEDDPERSVRMSNLGIWLTARSEKNDSEDDLEKAIEVITMAVMALPRDHHQRAVLFMNLADCYGMRVGRTHLEEDLQSQLACSIEGWTSENSPPSVRIFMARWAAGILGIDEKWKEASEILEGAVNLVPYMSPRTLKSTDQQHMLERSSGLASEAAAAALNAGKAPADALRLLELGRGVMASLLLETRTEIADLRQSHPELAEQFKSLRDELDSPPTKLILPTADNDMDVPSFEKQAKRRREMDQQFHDVVREIRTKVGFENFLLPPQIGDMLAAVSSGPIVVVNAHDWRCDAFIITSSAIEVLPLQTLDVSGISGEVEVSSTLLEHLWDTISSPVLGKLGFSEIPTDGNWPRVWWILAGSLSRLPVHAAGHHYENSSETVIDRVVSSYSTSIKALMQARQNSRQTDRQRASREACLVSMRVTPSHGGLAPGELEYAEEEIQTLESLLSPAISTTLLSQTQKDVVLRHIETCTTFHFAGHGITNPLDPSKSCLLLSDWAENPLTVEDLTALKLFEKPPWLAYLSACSTGENQAEKLQDESIHLVSACQLAGFPHVVGSLWKIDDEFSAEAAVEVYKTIQENGWTDEAVALGVHNAARLLRRKTGGGGFSDAFGLRAAEGSHFENDTTKPPADGESSQATTGRGLGYAIRNEGNPSIWAAYIHVGP